MAGQTPRQIVVADGRHPGTAVPRGSERRTAGSTQTAPEFQSRQVLDLGVVRRRLGEVRTFDESAQLCERMLPAMFADGTTRDAGMQEQLSIILKSLFSGLTAKGRERVWQAFFAGIDGNYVFGDHASAGASPLKEDLRAMLHAGRYGDTATRKAIEALVRDDLYASEIRDITKQLLDRHADFIAARYYRELAAAKPEGILEIGAGIADTLQQMQDVVRKPVRRPVALGRRQARRDRVVPVLVDRTAGRSNDAEPGDPEALAGAVRERTPRDGGHLCGLMITAESSSAPTSVAVRAKSSRCP